MRVRCRSSIMLVAWCAGGAGACASAPPAISAPAPANIPAPKPRREVGQPRVTALPLGVPVVETRDSAKLEGFMREAAVLETVGGEATFYHDMFDGRLTASGIVFRNTEPYAAHRSYPFGTIVRVTNLVNDRSLVVHVVDRLPPARTERAQRTIIDLSRTAAQTLGFIGAGRTQVRVEVLRWGEVAAK